jgi:hypothetical protein
MSASLSEITRYTNQLVKDWYANKKRTFGGWENGKQEFLGFMPEQYWCPIPYHTNRHEFKIIFLNINPGEGSVAVHGRNGTYVQLYNNNRQKYSSLLLKDLLTKTPITKKSKMDTNGYFLNLRFNWYAELIGQKDLNFKPEQFWEANKPHVFIAELCPFHTKKAKQIISYIVEEENLNPAWENLKRLVDFSCDLKFDKPHSFKNKIIARGAPILKLFEKLIAKGTFDKTIFESSLTHRKPGCLTDQMMQIFAFERSNNWTLKSAQSFIGIPDKIPSNINKVNAENLVFIFIFQGGANNSLPSLDNEVYLKGGNIETLSNFINMDLNRLVKSCTWRKVTP